MRKEENLYLQIMYNFCRQCWSEAVFCLGWQRGKLRNEIVTHETTMEVRLTELSIISFCIHNLSLPSSLQVTETPSNEAVDSLQDDCTYEYSKGLFLLFENDFAADDDKKKQRLGSLLLI